jgi:hypothetical protein
MFARTRLQLFDLFLKSQLLDLQTHDFVVGRRRAGQFLLYTPIEYPVLFREFCEMGS